MKRAIIIAVVAVILSIPLTSSAQTCSSPININAFLPSMRLNAVKSALLGYASHPEGDHYELCFIMDEMELTSTQLGTSFKLETLPAETKDVYVTGLKIKSNSGDPINIPIFVADNQGTGTIYLKNITLSNVKNGLQLAGTGKIEVGSYNDAKTVITGGSTKSGSCIDVKSPGAVLSGVQASSCHEGVKVDADAVGIKDKSIIKGNKIGVHILSGREGTAINGSKIYYNDDGNPLTIKREDGIRMDDGVMHEIVFYDVIDNEPVPILDGDDIIEYNDRKAYLLVDLSEGKTGSVEFFLSEEGDCGLDPSESSFKQVCGDVTGVTNPVSLNASNLSAGPMEVTLPPSYYGKALVAVYNDSERGTAGISHQFELNSGSNGVVAFVANPYDIPTSGGAVDTGTSGSSDDDDEQTTSGSGMDGVNTAGEGSSLIDAAGGPSGCGGGASIMALSWRDSSIAGVLWFLIVISAAIASLRLVRVHFKHRQR